MYKFKLSNYKFKFVFLALFIILILILRYIGLEEYISFEKVKLYENYLVEFTAQNYFLAVFFYILTFSLSILLFIPISVIMNLIAGLLFGLFWGTFYVNISTVFGSVTVFLIFRYLLGDLVRENFTDKLQNFDVNIKKHGASYLLFLQIFPATPVFLINIFSGLTRITLWTFIWTTSIGILPGSIIYVFVGQRLSKIEAVYEIFSWPLIILIFILLFLLSFSPILISRYFEDKSVIK